MKILQRVLAVAIAASAVIAVPGDVLTQQRYECTTTTTITTRRTTMDDGTVIVTTISITQRICVPI